MVTKLLSIGGLLLMLAASDVYAHIPDDSYIYLDIDSSHFDITWDISYADIEEMGFDLSTFKGIESKIDQQNIQQATELIMSSALTPLELTVAGKRCHLQIKKTGQASYTNGKYLSIQLHPLCKPAENLSVYYGFMFDEDSGHRAILLVNRNSRHASRHVLTNTKRVVVISTQYAQPVPAEEPLLESIKQAGNNHDAPSLPVLSQVEGEQFAAAINPPQADVNKNMFTKNRLTIARSYLVEGIRHILIGYDHILFLITLILPSVLVVSQSTTRRATPAVLETVKIVTAFTLAHSITLALAVLGLVSFSTVWVEIVIALTVLIAALDNIMQLFKLPRWLLTFFFGLAHGFGFASALSDLGLERASLFISLLSFNVGVELGQLLIVLLVFPLLYALRKSPLYEKRVVKGGSVVVIFIAIYWIITRSSVLQGAL